VEGSPALKQPWTACPWAPGRQRLKLTRDGLYICCWWSPHHVLFLLKKRGTVASIPSNVTRAAGLPFSNCSSISNSSQPSIPPKTMDSDTVHTTNFCITAQRLLEATKTHGKWGNVIKKTHNPCPFRSQKDSRSSPTAQTREGTTLLMWF
jgi:hypothetical protein